ncbi:MAG: class I SAM-dependent methyltransferase, partial [Planctomycetota bacterium]
MSFFHEMGYSVRSLTHRRQFRKRYDVINYFAHRRRRAVSYLEIGARNGRTLQRVRVRRRVGVDPEPRVELPGVKIHAQTSDDFFAGNEQTFDLVFVDGLHHADQVLRDTLNGLACLTPGGAVLLHDCNPLTEEAAARERTVKAWNGDVWKAVAFFRQRHPEVFCRVLDLDQGIGVIVPRAGAPLPSLGPEIESEAQRVFDG